MTPNFFQAATLKKIWVEATLNKSQVAPYKNLDRFYRIPFKSLLRVQIKRASMYEAFKYRRNVLPPIDTFNLCSKFNLRFQKSVGTLQPIYLQSSYAVIFRRFYPIPLLFPDEKRFDLLAFSAVSHLDALGVQVR